MGLPYSIRSSHRTPKRDAVETLSAFLQRYDIHRRIHGPLIRLPQGQEPASPSRGWTAYTKHPVVLPVAEVEEDQVESETDMDILDSDVDSDVLADDLESDAEMDILDVSLCEGAENDLWSKVGTTRDSFRDETTTRPASAVGLKRGGSMPMLLEKQVPGDFKSAEYIEDSEEYD